MIHRDARPTSLARSTKAGPDLAACSARTMLSLVLLLLGFFAVLNATAERNLERSDAVLASLAITFGPVLGEGTANPYSSQTGDIPAVSALADRVRDAFRAIVALSTTDDGAGRIAEVRIALAEVFVGDSAVLRPGADAVLKDLAEALGGVDPAIVPTLVVGVGTTRVGGPSATGAARQAAALAKALIASGLEPRHVVVGVDPTRGSAASFTFEWRRVEP